MNLFCRLGLHNEVAVTKFYPAIGAPIVTEFQLVKFCKRCGNKKVVDHRKWDGQDFKIVGPQ